MAASYGPWQVADELNAKLLELTGCKLAIVPIDKFDLLEKNARFMAHETFRNLVANIQKMGFQQWPFSLKIGDRFKVLSGNHRIMAAKEAGKTEAPTLYTDAELTEGEQVAIQLSHNAIAGQDDPVILKELWESLHDVDLKYFSGLDDKKLAELSKLQMPPLSEIKFDYRQVTIMFLPDEVDRIRAVFDQALKNASKEIFLAKFADFDRLMEDLARTSSAHNVKNTATAFMLMLDVFERHMTDLIEGWEKRDGGSEVPLASIFGRDAIPVKDGKLLKEAVDRLRDSGKIDGKTLWKSLEFWAKETLAK